MTRWQDAFEEPDETPDAPCPIWLVPSAGAAAWVESELPAAADMALRMGFSGELGQTLMTSDGLLCGVGEGRDPLALGAAASAVAKGSYRLASPLKGQALHLATLGWALGAYRFRRYLKASEGARLVWPEGVDRARLEREAAATYLARDLVNIPAEDMGPSDLAAATSAIADRTGARLSIVEGAALAKGFPLIQAVGRAAATPPKLIDLTWGKDDAPKITLVGKGV